MPQELSLLTLWSESTVVSAATWLLLIVATLYLARRPCQDLLLQTSAGLQRLLRLGARLLARQAAWLLERNREVLVAVAEDQTERAMERDLRRISRIIDRDLSTYPALHRTLSEQIARIDEDYRQSADIPPAPPAWLGAVEAVAAIEAKGDPAVTKILEDIHGTLQVACHNAQLEYRAASRRRHLGLKRMLPYWRQLAGVLGNVQQTVERLHERADAVDQQTRRYEEIRGRRERTIRALQSSALARFITSSLLLALAGLGVAVNLRLVYLPLGELLPLPAGLGFDQPEAAAVGLVAAQLLAGIAVGELLGITRLFPFLAASDEPVRKWGLRFALSLLLCFAALSAGMTWLVQLPSTLDGLGTAAQGWLPALAQTLLALILPLTLASVGLPLEAFVQSGRIVCGLTLVGLLRLLAVLLRLGAVIVDRLGRMLIQLYDVAIFLPLWIETGWRGRQVEERGRTQAPEQPRAGHAELD
jgi:hypothetical protein